VGSNGQQQIDIVRATGLIAKVGVGHRYRSGQTGAATRTAPTCCGNGVGFVGAPLVGALVAGELVTACNLLGSICWVRPNRGGQCEASFRTRTAPTCCGNGVGSVGVALVGALVAGELVGDTPVTRSLHFPIEPIRRGIGM
jgi:hypothetical protein